jgi:hypothetical protein
MELAPRLLPPPLLFPLPPSPLPLLDLLPESLLRTLLALPDESSVRGRRRVMRRRGSGANAARAPVAVPTRKHCSGVSAIAVMGPWLTSYVSTTCASAETTLDCCRLRTQNHAGEDATLNMG